MRSPFCLLVLPALCWCLSISTPAQAEPASPAARLRAARGHPADRILQLEGDFGTPQERRPVAFTFAADGRFVADYDDAVFPDCGYDGEQLWVRDAAGRTARDRGSRHDLLRFLHGALLGGVAAPPWQLTARDDDPVRLTAELPDRAFAVALHLDLDTGLPTRATTRAHGATRELRFVRWRSTPLGQLPAEVQCFERGHEVGTLRLTQLREAPEDQDFAPTAEARIDATVTLDAEGNGPLQTRKIASGHTFVRPRIDGVDLGWFAFDTGAAHTILHDRVLDRLSLTATGNTLSATGAGGSAALTLWRAKQLELGPVRLHRPRLTSLDLSGLQRAFGVELAGILGADVLAHAAWQIDVDAGHIAAFTPEAVPAAAAWHRFDLDGDHVVMDARLETHPGRFVVDTGGGGDALIVYHDTAHRHGLDQRASGSLQSRGVGGGLRLVGTSVGSFTFAGQQYRNLGAVYPAEPSGALADPYHDGLIGVHFLRGQPVVFDYPGRRLGFGAP